MRQRRQRIPTVFTACERETRLRGGEARLRAAASATLEPLESRVMLSLVEMTADPLATQGSNPQSFVAYQGAVYFEANIGGAGLWKSDGTAAGTTLLKPLPGSPLVAAAVSNNTLYWSAALDNNGVELWKSDGTAAGTVLVKNIAPGSAPSTPQQMTDVGGTLYFTADDGTHGRELWKSDGTAAGTVLVKDINPSGSSNPTNLTNVNGTLYFTANDGSHGVELWKSDGTASGTALVKDIAPGSASSSPAWLTGLAGRVFFAADDGQHGVELTGRE